MPPTRTKQGVCHDERDEPAGRRAADRSVGAAGERQASRHAPGFFELPWPRGRAARDDRALFRAEFAFSDVRHVQHDRQPDPRSGRDGGRHDLCADHRRHRPVGRLGAGAGRVGGERRGAEMALGAVSGRAAGPRRGCADGYGDGHGHGRLADSVVHRLAWRAGSGARSRLPDTNSRTAYIGDAFDFLSNPIAVGISPAFLIAVAVMIAAQLVLTRTVFGRYLVGIGTNEEAVRLAGVNPRPYKIIVFALMGALSGLAALFQISRLEAADPNAGVGLELQVIAAVVIGGTSLMGGRGSVISTFFGVLIISVLAAGLAQIGANEPTKRIITGAVIVVAVVLDTYRSRRKRI